MTPESLFILTVIVWMTLCVLGIALQVRGAVRGTPSVLGARLLPAGFGVAPLGLSLGAITIGLRDGSVAFVLVAIPLGAIGIVTLLAARSLRLGHVDPTG